MIRFKEFLVEGAYAKFKVGKEPKFKNKNKQTIANRLREFVKLNKNDIDEIHYPASGVSAIKGYSNNNQFEVWVTSKDVLARIIRYMDIFDVVGDNLAVRVKKGNATFLFSFSSGRGFFFNSEGKQTIPTTPQQETGTIKFLEYYQVNGTYPTLNQINEIVKFTFNDVWYKSFENQADAIIREVNLTSQHAIELDSDKKSIGYSIYGMLKTKFAFKEDKDNWNPADIWIYQSSKKSKILTSLDGAESVNDFNSVIKDLFEDGSLYGISLKKASGNKAKVKIIDTSNAQPFELLFGASEFNLKNKHYDFMTSGYPENFMMRVRGRAKTITKKKDLKIYFEGKIKNSKEFLGAVDKLLVTKLIGSDSLNFDPSIDDVNELINEVEQHGHMTILNKEFVENADELRLAYIYLMLRYANNIYKGGESILKKLALAGYKLNDFSSIHLKIGGK